MNLKANKRSTALLVIVALIWPSIVQAFFCFSVGAGAGSNKHRNRHYVRPPPPAGFDAVAYPVFRYSPVLPGLVARPDRLQEIALPAAPGKAVKQQIFE